MKIFRILLIYGIICLLLLPAFQRKFHFVNSPALKGYFSASEPAELTVEKWFNGSYQQQLSKNVEDSVGFRSNLIRL